MAETLLSAIDVFQPWGWLGSVTVSFPSQDASLVAIGLLVMVYLVSLISCNYFFRLKHEPPIMPSLIPWVGHGLSILKDPAAFITEGERKMGSVFVVSIAGIRQVFVLDAGYLKSISKSQYLSFDPITRMFRERLQFLRVGDFAKIDPKLRRGIEVSNFHGQNLRVMCGRMVHSLKLTTTACEYVNGLLRKRGVTASATCTPDHNSKTADCMPHITTDSHRDFEASLPLPSSQKPTSAVIEREDEGEYIGETADLRVLLSQRLSQSIPPVKSPTGTPSFSLPFTQKESMVVDLWELCRRVSFDVMTYSFFGTTFTAAYEPYIRMRETYGLLVSGLPGISFFTPQYWKDAAVFERLILGSDQYFWAQGMKQRADYHHSVGVHNSKFVGVFDGYITGLNMFIPVVFWYVTRIIFDGSLERRIRDEANNLFIKKAFAELTLDDVDSLPLCEAVLSETLRYYSTSSIVREVSADCQLEHSNGGVSYKIRKGDWVIFSPRFALHWNGDIHENPSEFNPARFLLDPATGEPCVNVNKTLSAQRRVRLLSGGTGRHLCPGQVAALNMAKLILLYLLFELEVVVSETSTLPQPNYRVTDGCPGPHEPFYVHISSRFRR